MGEWKWALLITLFQVGLVFALAPGNRTGNRFAQLCDWDCNHYEKIAVTGYVNPVGRAVTSDDIHSKRANAVFFPGFPLVARAVSEVTKLPAREVLVVLSQVFTFVFWLFFLLWLKVLEVPPQQIKMAVFSVALYPTAFYLVLGYTEAFFLAAMMSYFYWTEKWLKEGKKLFGVFAFLSGMVCGSIRIVAFALAPAPLLRKGLWKRKFHEFWAPLVVGMSVCLGAIGFFAFLHFEFGQWNLYFKLEEIGWGNHRDWFALLKPLNYLPRFFFEDTSDSLNRLAVPVFVFLLGNWIFVWKKRRFESGVGQQVAKIGPAVLSSFVMFYIATTGKANAHMESMARYTLPSVVLLCGAFALWPGIRGKGSGKVWATRGAWIFCAIVQVWFAYRFLRGAWIA